MKGQGKNIFIILSLVTAAIALGLGYEFWEELALHEADL